MARHHRRTDSATSSDAFRVQDAVEFRLNPRFLPPTDLLRRAADLLAASSAAIAAGGAALSGAEPRGGVVDSTLPEARVLDQLRALDDARAKREEEDETLIRDYLARKQEEKELKEKEEEEARKTKEAEDNTEKEERNASPNSSEEPAAASNVAAAPITAVASRLPTAGPHNASSSAPPTSSAASMAAALPPSAQNGVKTPFNVKEFEAETDPFESLELKSINDMKELADVLGQQIPPHVPYQQPRHQGPIQNHASNFAYPNQHAFMNQPAAAYSYFNQQPVATGGGFHHVPPSSSSVFQEPLKSSKSFGDITKEINQEIGQQGSQQEKRKINSFTPPPRVSALNRGGLNKPTQLEDWVPWPDLEPKPQEDIFSPLSNDRQRNACSQVVSMGFPGRRVVKVCQALKEDSDKEDTGKIIHFCILVDKFIEQEGGDEEDAIVFALVERRMKEDRAKKHVASFARLKVLGFEMSAIHEALIECEGDHDKTLERLLK